MAKQYSKAQLINQAKFTGIIEIMDNLIELGDKNGVNDGVLAAAYALKAKTCSIRGIEFSLSFAQYKRLANTKTCYYTGVRLTFDVGPNKITFDRINPDEPYTVENTVACASMFNNIKNALFESGQYTPSLDSMSKFILKLQKIGFEPRTKKVVSTQITNNNPNIAATAGRKPELTAAEKMMNAKAKQQG